MVTVLYFCPLFTKSARRQNLLVLSVSYLFYAAWDWRFLFLIIFTTLCTYAAGILIGRYRNAIWLIANVVLNLSVLAVFKYFNFFSENIIWFMRVLGFEADWFTIDVLLPVGISFYTFQAIGYTVDVWRGAVKPTGNIVLFATFIAYFPQLVAGPIERASAIMPQLDRVNRWRWNNGADGLRLILWGLFKKVAVADPCGYLVDGYYAQCVVEPDGLRCYIAAVLFAVQLYCDFSGYCDIAAGSARMLGVDLTQNFNRPYISRNFVEFWRRWHISLTKWFTDYLYIPMGGSRKGTARHFLNVMVVFLISGLWHGAGWGFIIWGAGCGVCYLLQKTRGYDSFRGKPQPSVHDLPEIFATFSIFAVLLVPFRLNGDISLAMELGLRYIVPVSMMAVLGFKVVFRIISVIDRTLLRGRYAADAKSRRIVFYIAVAVLFGTFAWCCPKMAWYHLYLVLALLVYSSEWIRRGAKWGSCPFPLPVCRISRTGLYMCLYLLILTYGLLRLPPVSDGTTFLYFQF